MLFRSDLEAVIDKLMSREPSDRYQDGEELSRDLQRIADGEPVHIRRLPWHTRLWRRARKNPVLSGAIVASRGVVTAIPPFPVTAVDTVAAGDVFSGALGVALAEGADLPAAARFAAAAAAISVTREGAQASAPSRDEIERFLAGGD